MTEKRLKSIIQLDQPPYNFRKVSRSKINKLCNEHKLLHAKWCPKCYNAPEIIIRTPTIESETIKIKCPNCGYEKEFFIDHDFLECENTSATPITLKNFTETLLKAIQYWNTKAQKTD